MQLSSKQISHLRGLAHSLHAVVMIGNNGLTEQVIKEVDSSLNAHELIKIQVAGDDRAYRIQLLEDICAAVNAVPVHHIGKQLVIYRAAQPARIVLPK